jgi:hypothetical protein
MKKRTLSSSPYRTTRLANPAGPARVCFVAPTSAFGQINGASRHHFGTGIRAAFVPARPQLLLQHRPAMSFPWMGTIQYP